MRVDIDKLANEIQDYIERKLPTYVRKEELAKLFKVKEHHADQALRVLNLRGVVKQAQHNRCCCSGPRCSSWFPDTYAVRSEFVLDLRVREKQASRDEDRRRLEAGEVTREQLREENGVFGKLAQTAKMVWGKGRLY